jgi:hypothetical protein
MKTLYAVLAAVMLAAVPSAHANYTICKLGVCYIFPDPTPAPTVCYDQLKRVVACSSVK